MGGGTGLAGTFFAVIGVFCPGGVFRDTTLLGGVGGLIPGGRVEDLGMVGPGRVADLLEKGGVLGVVVNDGEVEVGVVGCFASFFSWSRAGW